MSFLKLGKKELEIGLNVANQLKDLLDGVKDVRAKQGLSYLKALEHVIENNAGLKEAGEKLLEWVSENGPESLRDLFTSLSDIEQRDKEADRQLGWPTLSWKKDGSSVKGDVNYGFDIEVTGGVSFDVLKDEEKEPENLPAFNTYEAVAKISIDGSLKGGVKGSLKIPVGGINANVDGEFTRSIEYYYGFEDHSDLAGVAVVSALTQLSDPSNGPELLDQFNSGRMARLQGIIVEGSQGIGAGADVTANFPTQFGSFGIKLGGKIKTSSSFGYTITRGDDVNSLNLTADTGKESSNSGTLGVSYVVGLSTLAPGAAQELLSQVKEVHELIVEIDEKIDGYSDKKILTWLKPGHLLKEKLGAQIQSFFNKHKKWDTTVIAGLSRLFGLEVDGKTKVADALKKVNSLLTNVISELLDEVPDLFDLDANEISEKIVKALSPSMDSGFVEMLNQNVFTKIKGLLDAELKKVANGLDKKTQQKIKDILNKPPKKVIDNVKEFIDKVRGISKQILDKVSQAQTDLLSAEIGWRRAQSASKGTEYEASFDFSNNAIKASVQASYRQAVMSPSGFGELIFTEQKSSGVTITKQSARYKLTKETGHRWSIAVVGIGFIGKVSKLSDIQIDRSPEGASIQVSGNVTKERDFWNETRRVSFVSALNVYESTNHNTEVKTYPEGAKSKVIKVKDDPRASASIKISFEEEDKKLAYRETQKFLRRFVKSNVLSEETRDAFLGAYLKEREALNKFKIPATITIGLAIPSDMVLLMLEHTGEEQGLNTNVQERLKQALVKHDTEWVDEGIKSSPDGMGIIESANLDFETIDEVEKNEIRMEFLNMAIAESYLAEDGMGFWGSSNKVGDAIIAFEKVLQIAAELYYEPGTPEHGAPEDEWKTFQKTLRKKQDSMNKYASKFLKAGRVGPGLWGGKAPSKTVAMYEAMQQVTKDITGIKPPLIVTLNPKDRDPVSFVDLKN